MGLQTLSLNQAPMYLQLSGMELTLEKTNITVSGDATFTLNCQLTNIKITVKNTDGITMPFVDLNIAYHYQSSSGTKTGSASGQTDSSGSYTLTSTFAGSNLHH